MVKGHGDLEKAFEFYALLATRFSLLIRHLQQREAQCCARTIITALTACFVYLFKLQNFWIPPMRFGC